MDRPVNATKKVTKAKGRQGIVFKKPLIAILIASSIAAIYVYIIVAVTAAKFMHYEFENYIFRYEDRAFKVRHWYYSRAAEAKDYLKPKDVVLVTIDEESYKRLEKRWPWGRDVFAEFIDRLSKYRPKTVALDFALYGKTPDNPEADKKLAEAIRRSGNVIIASVYGKEKLYLGPYDIFAKASAGYGVIGAVRDIDDAIRKIKTFALVLSPEKGGDISFEVKTAAHYLGVPYGKIYEDEEQQGIIFESKDKRIKIPTDENHYILINYLSDKEDIKTVPIWKVMADNVPKGMFKDKLVLVSQTGEIFHDLHQTPFGLRSGGLIITNVLNSIVSSNYIRRQDPLITWPTFAFIYILGFIIFYKLQPLKGFFILIITMAALLAGSISLFLNKGIMWPTFYAVALLPLLFLGITFYKYANVLFEGAQIKRMAITDSLTGLYTHRYFRFLLEHSVNKVLSFGSKCSLIAIKVLNIDRIIKELSFNKGQTVQRKIAELIKMKLPKKGSGAFLGMGEFSMLLPGVGLYEALGIAGSLRSRIKEADFGSSEGVLKPIIAVGVSAVNPAAFPKTGIELMRSARTAMARAKEMGYNKICRFNPKVDSSIFEPNIMEKEIRQRLDDEFSFLAVDLEERNKELEDLLRQLSITQRDLEQAHFETLRSLIVALEEKDPCTAGHSERVGAYAEKIGRKLKMPEEELVLLRQAGVLHDIGKVGIPQDILRKEDTLNPSERHIIQLHPEFSVRILNTSKYFTKMLHGIRDHHERLDGSGYPRGLKGDEISVEAQIIAVCDVFDALTGDRPYRKALTSPQAISEILAHPEQYNRDIALALKQVLHSE
jgi:diguanylate cyclase (GGDEF)-like protein